DHPVVESACADDFGEVLVDALFDLEDLLFHTGGVVDHEHDVDRAPHAGGGSAAPEARRLTTAHGIDVNGPVIQTGAFWNRSHARAVHHQMACTGQWRRLSVLID